MCRKLHTLRGLSGRSELIRSSEVAGPEATPFTSSPLQIAILLQNNKDEDLHAASCSWCRRQHKAVKRVCWCE